MAGQHPLYAEAGQSPPAAQFGSCGAVRIKTEQQNPEEVSIGSEVQRRNFRNVYYQGPRETCNRLHHFCNEWLKPERHTKEQMLDLVVLEQLLILLPSEIESLVREYGPETSSQAVVLAEGFLMNQKEEEFQVQNESWVRECGPETSSQAVALAEGFVMSQVEEQKEEEIKLQVQRPLSGAIPERLDGNGNPLNLSQELLIWKISQEGQTLGISPVPLQRMKRKQNFPVRISKKPNWESVVSELALDTIKQSQAEPLPLGENSPSVTEINNFTSDIENNLPECWTVQQYNNFKEKYDGLEISNKKLGCTYCAKHDFLKMRSIHVSKEWKYFRIEASGRNKEIRQSSLRKKMKEHFSSKAHNICKHNIKQREQDSIGSYVQRIQVT